jgi:hypothetical protein
MEVDGHGRRARGAIFAVVSLLLLGTADPAGAQHRPNHRGTPEEQAACQPDVFRLCFGFIPDEGRIVACLQRRIRELSPACRAVFEEPPRAKPRKPRRPQQPPPRREPRRD